MCYHYELRNNWEPASIADALSLGYPLIPQQLIFGEFYSMKRVPVIRWAEGDALEMVAAEWGLLPKKWNPNWRSKTKRSHQRGCFNAKSEEVHKKQSYRQPFRTQRCLIPATSFEEKGYWFHLEGRRPFAFAGLWDLWEGDGEPPVLSCSFLTTEPNETVRGLGPDRMPVMLTTPEDRALWLSSDVTERGPLERLFHPIAPGLLEWGPA